MKVFCSHWPRCLAPAVLPGSAQVAAQASAVPATGIAPRFPKADAELAKQAKPPSQRWLMDANDDTERMRRLELWGGAGDLEMQDIAHRLEELHSAIQSESWDLGIYQLGKVRGRMLVAAIKRPTRTQNLEDVFLESGIDAAMHSALTSKTVERARAIFEDTRLACHAAEKLAFINDSKAFKRVESFPPFKRSRHARLFPLQATFSTRPLGEHYDLH